MKEKTFEELIEEKEGYSSDWLVEKLVIESETVLQLLQQVREATIAECMERIIELNGQENREPIKAIFDTFPTDRIKTEK